MMYAKKTLITGLALLVLASPNCTINNEGTDEELGYSADATYGSLVKIYRLYNGEWIDHFYTTSHAEVNNALDNLGFEYEGILGECYTFKRPGTTPLYRLYHKVSGKPNHFYTISGAERDNAIRNSNYISEGITCYVPVAGTPGAVPVYRAVHRAPDHIYTTSESEAEAIRNDRDWTYEGTAFHVFPEGTAFHVSPDPYSTETGAAASGSSGAGIGTGGGPP